VISGFSHCLRAGFEPAAHGFGPVKAVGAASHSEFAQRALNSARFQLGAAWRPQGFSGATTWKREIGNAQAGALPPDEPPRLAGTIVGNMALVPAAAQRSALAESLTGPGALPDLSPAGWALTEGYKLNKEEIQAISFVNAYPRIRCDVPFALCLRRVPPGRRE
jgi:hypothetical protein